MSVRLCRRAAGGAARSGDGGRGGPRPIGARPTLASSGLRLLGGLQQGLQVGRHPSHQVGRLAGLAGLLIVQGGLRGSPSTGSGPGAFKFERFACGPTTLHQSGPTARGAARAPLTLSDSSLNATSASASCKPAIAGRGPERAEGRVVPPLGA